MARSSILLCFTLIFYCSTFLQVCVHCGDRDDELIATLLAASEKSIDELDDSQVAKIFKALEAAENTILSTPQEGEEVEEEEALSEEETLSEESNSDSSPEINYLTTTPKPDPFFFNTQAPFYPKASANANTSEVDEEAILMELEKAILGAGEEAAESSINKRSSYGWGWHHDPPLDGLLWGTAKAVWDIARPSFYKTKAGLKVAVIKDTLTLPLRTFGHIKSHVLDLTNPGKRSIHGWGGWGSLHDHHDHGWGWDKHHHHPVYVKYEPNNSLFKSWLRFILRVLRPAVIKTYHLKRTLFWLKLRLLGSLIKILKYSKLKGITELIKSKLKPNIVVVTPTEEPVVHHHGWDSHGWEDPHAGWPGWIDPSPQKGWSGWAEPVLHPTKGWHAGWSESVHHHKGWVAGPPPIKAKYGHPPPPDPAPKPSYGPPSQLPSGYDFYSTPMQSYGAPPPASSPPDSMYGPPAASSDGYAHNYLSPPRVKHSPTAYSKENTYSNPNGPAAASMEPPPSSLDQVADPSYNKYLKQLGINTDDLSPESVRNLRESEKEDVPYLTPSDSASTKEEASVKETAQ